MGNYAETIMTATLPDVKAAYEERERKAEALAEKNGTAPKGKWHTVNRFGHSYYQ